VGWVIGLALVAVASLVGYAVWFLRWFDRETLGTAYFARSAEGRRAFKEQVARHGRVITPIAGAIAAIPGLRRIPSFEFDGVSGPIQTCSARLYERTKHFVPDEHDVFVATQMKCGTTWMQQVVYEVLSRGKGDLSDDGHRHMYAVSPWIESRHSVSLDAAPRIGPEKMRIIKTHMPTRLCPYSEKARYIYVLRHPVACFSSTADFLSMLGGPLIPPSDKLLDWYCSDDMYWRSWPEHADGWWRWAQERPNVLFVHYEEMLDDLPAVVAQVAGLLDVALTGAEIATVAEKSGFEYMKAHEDVFEMAPPSPFSAGGAFLKSGSRTRERDRADTERQRILAFCRERLADSAYPAERFYPELSPGTNSQ
jgi:hypothetical protein